MVCSRTQFGRSFLGSLALGAAAVATSWFLMNYLNCLNICVKADVGKLQPKGNSKALLTAWPTPTRLGDLSLDQGLNVAARAIVILKAACFAICGTAKGRLPESKIHLRPPEGCTVCCLNYRLASSPFHKVHRHMVCMQAHLTSGGRLGRAHCAERLGEASSLSHLMEPRTSRGVS